MPATIAAIQMCSSHVVDENLSTAGRLIATAASNQAKMVVLPEMFAIMGEAATDKVYVREEFGSGKIQDFLAQQARDHKIWIVGGTIPIACEATHKVKAASIVFDDKGHAVARYDKIHLFDIKLSEKDVYKESDTTLPGNQVVLVDTPFGKLGLAVCYDVRFRNCLDVFLIKAPKLLFSPPLLLCQLDRLIGKYSLEREPLKISVILLARARAALILMEEKRMEIH